MPDLGLTDSLGALGGSPQPPTDTFGTIGSLLSHPLVQGALATYFGAISSPRREGWGGAIGHGGLAGLGQYGQAQQLRQQLPYLQARTAGEQAGAKLSGLQAQRMESELAPLNPEEVKGLDTMIARAKDPEEQSFFSYLKSEYQNRRITPDELAKHIETYNQSKRQADMLKAYGTMYGQQITGQFLNQMGFHVPAPNMPPGMGAPPATPGMSAGSGGLGPPTHTLNGRGIVYNPAASHWVYADDGSPAG